MIYRRQRQQFFFAGFLVVLAAVNVLFLLILHRPAQNDYARLQESIRQSRELLVRNRRFVEDLGRASDQLGRFDRDKQALLVRHLLERNVGYSEVLTRLDTLVQKTGVKKTRVTYNKSDTGQSGLSVVSIVLPLEGNYSNVVNFIRELENSEIFFLISRIGLESTSPANAQPVTFGAAAAAPSAGVALALGLETYFYE